MWKRYANYEGGTADPLIVSWPAAISAAGEIRRQYTHAIDIVPTLLECLGVELPDVVKGYTQRPLEGVSFEASFADPDATTGKETQFYLDARHPRDLAQGLEGRHGGPGCARSRGADFHQQRWELFDTTRTRASATTSPPSTPSSCRS